MYHLIFKNPNPVTANGLKDDVSSVFNTGRQRNEEPTVVMSEKKNLELRVPTKT